MVQTSRECLTTLQKKFRGTQAVQTTPPTESRCQNRRSEVPNCNNNQSTGPSFVVEAVVRKIRCC